MSGAILSHRKMGACSLLEGADEQNNGVWVRAAREEQLGASQPLDRLRTMRAHVARAPGCQEAVG